MDFSFDGEHAGPKAYPGWAQKFQDLVSPKACLIEDLGSGYKSQKIFKQTHIHIYIYMHIEPLRKSRQYQEKRFWACTSVPNLRSRDQGPVGLAVVPFGSGLGVLSSVLCRGLFRLLKCRERLKTWATVVLFSLKAHFESENPEILEPTFLGISDRSLLATPSKPQPAKLDHFSVDSRLLCLTPWRSAGRRSPRAQGPSLLRSGWFYAQPGPVLG